MLRYLPFTILLIGCFPEPSMHMVEGIARTDITLRNDLRGLYDSLNLSGSFILHDMGKDRWLFIDSAQADVATLPASTFKIFGSLIGLEAGVLADADHLYKWDGTNYGRPEVNKDLTLREAYQTSAYWYYRRMAQELGPEGMKHWLDNVGYGNADTTGGYDRTWVAGGLRITPRQQVEFLERIYNDDLPVSQRTMDIVKDIMVQGDTLGYVLRGKTGWSMNDAGSIGWYVGWVEKSDGTGPYFFANRIMTPDTMSQTFAAARINIAMEVLARTGLIRR